MPILGAFVVPHPPLIVKEIGKGNEKQVQKTIESYEEIAKEIKDLNPETIIISSPHAPMYSDYFYISPNDKSYGNFSSFNAPEIEFYEEYDVELVKNIEELSKEKNFPAGTEGYLDNTLDHGTMVPLYFIRKELPKCKIIRVSLSNLSLLRHFELGEIIEEATNKLNRRVVFVASGDLSHKLKEYGPYGYIKEGPEYDQKIMKTLREANFTELLEYKEEFLEKASECGHRSFTILAGFLNKLDLEAKELSHEDTTGVGYGIISYKPIRINEKLNYKEEYLTKERERIKNKRNSNNPYISLAYKAIDKIIIDNELLNNKSAMFTSIHEFDKLRGCIGTFLPTKENIAEELISSAINAATNDYRFPKIEKDELPYLDVTVYKLYKPEKVDSTNDLDPKKYGVIVSTDYKRGLLLPDLPGVDTVEEQIQIARRKGNILPEEEIIIERFLVEKYDY